MFATLDLNMSNTTNATQSSSAGRTKEGNTTGTRPKRSQVRRACDWCKLMRIKCDNDRPCRNCQQGGRECGMNNKNQFRSLAAAIKEVEVLRAQMRELEANKRQFEKSHKRASTSDAERPSSSQCNSPPSERQLASRNGVRVESILWGIASWPFFLVRLNEYLHVARAHLDVDLLACAAGTPASPWLRPDALRASFLPIHQERHFLSLFWQTHYFSFPFVSEAQFRQEYQELTADTAPSATRQASPLADIVLALCLQLGSLRMNGAGDAKSKYPSLAGYQYYRRGQQAIDQTIETPNLRTVQCYVYSIVYLLEAGFLNRAQVTAGKAITVALLLGLSHEPPLDIPEPEREVARRTWWSLYTLDALLSMEVGRPPMISASHSTCQFPTDSVEVAQWLAPHYRHDDACPPWVGFQTKTLHLFRAVRTVRATFNAVYDTAIGQDGYEVFVSNGEAREECARALMEPIKELEQWIETVATGYVMPRKEGRAFSRGERFTLDLELKPNVLIHCQRQRLLLEMQYYHQCMALYRPFICVGTGAGAESSTPTPLSDGMAATGLAYAAALTSMIYQALTDSEALSGTYSVFRLQKNALFVILGFAYTFPLTQRDTISRALEEGLAVVERYQNALPDAHAVAAAVRTLSDDLGTVFDGFYDESGWSSSPPWLTSSGTSPKATAPPHSSSLIIRPDTIVVANHDGSAMGSLPATTGMLDRQGLVTPAILSPELTKESMFDCNAFDMSGGLEAPDMSTDWNDLDIFWGGIELGEAADRSQWPMMDIGATSNSESDEMHI